MGLIIRPTTALPRQPEPVEDFETFRERYWKSKDLYSPDLSDQEMEQFIEQEYFRCYPESKPD